MVAHGARLGLAHSAASAAERKRPNDRWCRSPAGDPGTVAGAVLTIDHSRKLPWARLARIRHAVPLLSALGPEGLAELVSALRSEDSQLLRLSVHAYASSEAVVEEAEAILRAAGFQPESRERDFQRTLLVSLEGDEAALLARLAYSARRGIRNAEKGNWQVRPITDQALAPRLQHLHEAAHERTGGNPHPLDLAAAVAIAVADPTSSVVFGVYHPERSGDAALVGFVHGVVTADTVIYSTAGTERAPDIGSAPLGYGLVGALMRWGQELGVPWFDFGGITPEDQPDHPLARISEFKRKFRGEERRIASDWFVDLAPMQARLLDLSAKAAAILRPR
jgi:hypothetical protein